MCVCAKQDDSTPDGIDSDFTVMKAVNMAPVQMMIVMSFYIRVGVEQIDSTES